MFLCCSYRLGTGQDMLFAMEGHRTGKRRTKSHGWKRQDWKTRDQIFTGRKGTMERETDKYRCTVYN